MGSQKFYMTIQLSRGTDIAPYIKPGGTTAWSGRLFGSYEAALESAKSVAHGYDTYIVEATTVVRAAAPPVEVISID